MKSTLVQFVMSIPGWLTYREGVCLEWAVQSRLYTDGVIVEIGSYCGKSTIWLAQWGDTVYAVDPHKGNFSGGSRGPTYEAFMDNIKTVGLTMVVVPVRKTSEEAAKTWKKPVKVLFIDGLHDEAHARQDYQMWSKFFTEDAIVLMHDAFCGWDGAGKVAREYIVHGGQFARIGVAGSIIYGMKGTPTQITRIIKVFKTYIIELCEKIYASHVFPYWVKFILVHKVLKIFLR